MDALVLSGLSDCGPYRLPLRPLLRRAGSNERRVLTSPSCAYQFHNCKGLYLWPTTQPAWKSPPNEKEFHWFSPFFSCSPTTKPSTLNAQQLKIIFHLPFTQLLVNFPFSPRGHEPMANKKQKKVANKATHQQAEKWEPGFLVLDHFVMPTICCQYFANFFPVRISPLVCLQLCSNWKITTCTTISVSVQFFFCGKGKGFYFRLADNRF